MLFGRSLFLSLVVAAPLLVACALEAPVGLTAPASGDAGGGTATSSDGSGGSGGQATPEEAKALFDALEPDLLVACGTCHDSGGVADTPFLAGPDRYLSITMWPGVIEGDPAKSKLVTHPMAGTGHIGTDFDDPATNPSLLPRVEAWLKAEASARAPKPADPTRVTAPFVPAVGFNSVSLGALKPSLTGMAITFRAGALTSKSLELTDLAIETSLDSGVHVVHPLFSVYGADGAPDPDPIDSFSSLDETVDADTSAPLGPGGLVLVNWVPGASLSIAFEAIDATGN